MRNLLTKRRATIAGAAIGGGIVAVLWALMPPKATDGAQAQLVVPELEGDALAGAALYSNNCAACHGENGVGTEGAGPPFLHKVYEPSHHGDGAFFLAALQGVRAHHWRFGDMPPVEGITEAEVAKIIVYIRQLQKANGVF